MYWFSATQQRKSITSTHTAPPLRPPSHLPPHPTPQAVTEHRAELPVIQNFPQVICFTYGTGHVSVLLLNFVPPFSPF